MRPEQEQEGVDMKFRFWITTALLLPIGSMSCVQAQPYQQRSLGPSVVIVPPAYPGSDGNTGSGYDMPFPSPQAGQQRLLEMLDTGGIERPSRGIAAPQGCIYSGQIYSEGAMVRNEAGRQVCGPRAGAEPDASGQMPLSWRAVPGE